MLEILPDSTSVAALQAGLREADSTQRVLVATSNDGGITFGPWHVAVPSPGDAQWEPTLFYDTSTGVLWLFYTEGPALIYASVSREGGKAGSWSPRRLLWNATEHGHSNVWVLNRVVVLPGGRWVLPCDLGCTYPTGAFALVSDDAGSSWSAGDSIPGTNIPSCCPEPGVAAVGGGGSDLIAVIRSATVGLLQSRSTDGGETWSPAVAAGVDGASSKPSVTSVEYPATAAGAGAGGVINGSTLVLAYNIESRLRMGLAVSRDGGASWTPWAVVDNGTGLVATFYPTVLFDSSAREVVTVYSATRTENATSNKCPRLDERDNARAQHSRARSGQAATARSHASARAGRHLRELPVSLVDDAAETTDSAARTTRGHVHRRRGPDPGRLGEFQSDHVVKQPSEGCYTDMRLARTPLP